MTQPTPTERKLTREQVQGIAGYGPYDVKILRNAYGQAVCLHCDYIEPDHAA